MKKILQLLILFLGVSQSQLKAQGTFDNSSLVIIWKTDNPGTSDSSSITIPLIPNHDFGYDVDWDNDGVFDEFDIAGTITHDFGAPGTYTIRIRSEFIFLYFNNEGDKEKIIDIAQWGDIKWHNFYKAFHGCSNLNISATDAPVFPSGASFASSFSNCTSLNSSLDHWDVSNVTTFYRTFAGCTNFNQPLNNWDVSSAAGFERTFENCINFNQPLDQWDVSNAIGFGGTFYGCASFNQPLHTWDVSSVKNMKLMFTKASSFNQDIGNWDVSNVTNMAIMFHKATSFNQDISNWDVGNVADMNSMFKTATVFNQDIGNWDVSKVTKMNWMFAGAKAFNQDIGNWDVSNVTNMNWMFFYADSFNQDVGNWDVGNVQHMQNMFKGPNNQFNQDIGNWDVSNVIDMNSMFEANPSFDQNIGNWDVSNVVTMERMFNLAKLSTPNYDSLLIGWNSQVLQDSVRFHGGYSIYCKGYAARANMISSNYWEIKDGGSEKNAPVVICKDITIELDENGYAEITADVFDDGSYDDCTDLLFTVNKTTFDCSDIGTQPNTLIVEDANGNIDSCMVSLTILDTPFNFSCPSDITVNANHEGCSGKVNWVAPQETCTNSITSNYESGSIFPLGTTEVIYQTTDESSNVETCSFTITVVNNLDLEINNIIHPDCFGSQNGQVVITPSNGVAPYSYDWSNDGINDFDDPQNPDNLGVGNYNVVIKDSVGCTTNDSVELLPFQISISNCPQDITVSARHEDCTALVTWDIPVENCSGTELLSDFESGDQSYIVVDAGAGSTGGGSDGASWASARPAMSMGSMGAACLRAPGPVVRDCPLCGAGAAAGRFRALSERRAAGVGPRTGRRTPPRAAALHGPVGPRWRRTGCSRSRGRRQGPAGG